MALSPWEHPLDLLIVFTCFRAADLTIDCLRTLEPELRGRPGVKVMICENGTGPESVARLEEAIREGAWQDQVVLRPIHPNRGFAGGNNVILREAMTWPEPPRNFLLLNTDTLVRPGAIASLLEAAAREPTAGVIGARLEWPDGDPQISAFRYLSPISEMLAGAATGPLTSLFRRWKVPLPLSDEPIEAGWLSFACALIRREVVEAIGVLDEGYYLYFDDVDYCRVARRAGWRVLYWPYARVVHLRGQSNPVKSLARDLKRRPRYYYASRARYFAKFYGRGGLWVTNLLWGAGRIVALLRETLGSKAPHTCERQWRDLWVNALAPLKPPAEADMQGRDGIAEDAPA